MCMSEPPPWFAPTRADTFPPGIATSFWNELSSCLSSEPTHKEFSPGIKQTHTHTHTQNFVWFICLRPGLRRCGGSAFALSAGGVVGTEQHLSNMFLSSISCRISSPLPSAHGAKLCCWRKFIWTSWCCYHHVLMRTDINNTIINQTEPFFVSQCTIYIFKISI